MNRVFIASCHTVDLRQRVILIPVCDFKKERSLHSLRSQKLNVGFLLSNVSTLFYFQAAAPQPRLQLRRRAAQLIHRYRDINICDRLIAKTALTAINDSLYHVPSIHALLVNIFDQSDEALVL